MKLSIIIVGVLCLGIAAAILYSKHKTGAQTPAVADSATAKSSIASETKSALPKASLYGAKSSSATPRFLAKHSSDNPATDVNAVMLKEAIDQIVSPRVAFKNRQEIWKQLIADGRLDETIDALKQGATNNPDSADYQAALGEANLKKAGIVSQKGGSANELGILGMTADQSFDNALKLDPANWDAQFFKAVAMSYWPADLNKGNEVVNRFAALISQQETQTLQPEFALSYIALGQQYQKLGQNASAVQTWQAGAAKFPGDATLQQKLAAAAH